MCRWGIVGSGGISAKFAADLALDPAGRDVHDVAHAVVVVGSREVSKAEHFVKDACPQGGYAQQAGLYSQPVRAVGTYEEVYNDPEVDIVYIGTPHTLHFTNAKDALEAGKGVLLEKPATLNGKESRILFDLAREKGLFLMEAVWTRFFPLAYKFQELLHKEKAIGDIHHVVTDFGMGFFHTVPESHRVFNPDLGGSAQLDIGPYSILWGILALHEHPENALEPPSKINATSLPDPRTGVDLFTNITLDFKKITARASCMCNNIVSGSGDGAVRVLGTEGEIILPGALSACRPEQIVVRKYKGELPLKLAREWEDTKYDFPIQGTGLHWEADAVARYVRDGKKTSDRCSPETTALTMNIIDEWVRQTEHKYVDGLEKA